MLDCAGWHHNQRLIYINSFRWRLGIIRPVHHVAQCRARAATAKRVTLGSESRVLNPYGTNSWRVALGPNTERVMNLTLHQLFAPQQRRIRSSTHSNHTAASS